MAHDNGLKKLRARLDAVKLAGREAAMQALIKGAHQIADRQRQLAPEDEGDLKDSITVTEPGQTTPPHSQPGGNRVVGEDEVVVTAGNSDVRYPHHVEHGTVKMEAQPYFGVGYRMERDRVKRNAAAAFRRAAKKEWGK